MNPSLTLWRYDWHQRGMSPKTFSNMERELERFSEWLGRDLLTCTQADCLTFLYECRTPAIAEMSWRALRSFYAFVSAEDGTASPMERVKAPKRPEAHVSSVSEGDYRKLLGTCGNTATDKRDAAIITLLWESGLRRTEVANLLLDDVDDEHVIVRTSKTGKPRVVPLSTSAHVALLRYLRVRPSKAADALWFGRKGGLGSDGIRLMLERRSLKAGVRVSAHQFRRAFAVGWLVDGGSQVSLQNICGWSSPAMPARYTRHAGERLASAEMKRLRG